MRARQIAIPRLLEVGPGCLARLASLLRQASFDLSRVCVATGPGPSSSFGGAARAGLLEGGVDAIDRPIHHGTLGDAAQLAAEIIEGEFTLAVAVGGGRVIDTVKLAAARSGIELVSCPTTIAHDGISSPVASLVSSAGVRRSFAAAVPAGLVIDVDVVASAPARTLRAGVGDLASNLTAILDWRLADRRGLERFDAFSATVAETAARSLFELTDLESTAAHELLAKGLLLSGLAMAAAGSSRPCSGAEHLFSHSLDEQLGRANSRLHGEQVALGTLLAAAAHGAPVLGELRALFERLGLPLAPRELELDDATVLGALRGAPATRPERYTVLSELSEADDGLESAVARAFGR